MSDAFTQDHPEQDGPDARGIAQASPSGASSPSGGIQVMSGQSGGNFPWLVDGETVSGAGLVTYLWTPSPGDGVDVLARLLDAPFDDVPVGLVMRVMNLDATEVITVTDATGLTVADADGFQGYGLTADAEPSADAGTDLTYDSDEHQIVSAAGGVFFVQAGVFISND